MAKVNRTNSKNKKSSSRLTRFSAHLKSHKKTTAAVSVIMIALVGGLVVRFSQAATGYIWAPNQVNFHNGKLVRKSDGRPAIESINWNGTHYLTVYVTSSVSNDDTYCFSGKTAKELRYRIDWYYFDPNPAVGGKGGGSGGGSGPVLDRRAPAGDFLVCQKVPGRNGSAPGMSRNIQLTAESSGLFAVYQVGRRGY